MWRSSVVVSALALLSIGCAADSSAESGAGVIRSETVPGQGAADVEVADPGAGEGVSPSPGSDAGRTAGDDGPPTELSTDPAIVYQPDTCHEPPAPGVVAEQVDCSEPHTVEVYAVGELPGGPDAPFQGLDEAIALCDDDFTRITGVGIGLATIFRRSVLRPSEETWAEGEREVTCFVVFPEPVTAQLGEIDPLRNFGLVSLYGMNEGDCFADFDDEATRFTLVPCSEPHDAEVFVDVELPDGPYPGDAAIEETADQLCFGTDFTDFVGVEYEASELSSLRSRPTEETWAAGDHTINCILTDGAVHTSSLRGSGR